MIVPDAIEPIVAWRYWNLNGEGQLESPIQDLDGPWLPGERKEAKCCDELLSRIRALRAEADSENDPGPGDLDFLIEHEAPLESCWCGIHAAKDLETLRVVSGPGPVVGEVYLWGKVIPGENGYRAQYAYPKSLRLISNGVFDHELEQLRAYCGDVGMMTPREAWGSWGSRAFRWVRFIGRVMIDTPLGAAALILAAAAYKEFLQ